MIRFLSMLAAALTFSSAALAADDYVILKVGTEEIKRSEVLEIWQNLFPQGGAPSFDSIEEPVRLNVLRGVASEHVIYTEAIKSDIGETEEVKHRLAQLRKKVITQAFLDRQAEKNISDEELNKAYEERKKKFEGKEEVRARHILVENEDKAKDIAEEIEDGKNFEELAKELSEDKASAVTGGDLGYFTEDKMVPEFAKAAFSLDKGEVSEPVKTDFGWHIIRVEDKRPVAAPPFEEVKGQLMEELKGESLKNYVDDLVDSTDIKYYGADGKELAFTRVPDRSVADDKAATDNDEGAGKEDEDKKKEE